MAINWSKSVRRDRGTWMRAGIFAFVASVVFFYLYFDREPIRSKNDITFFTGTFKEYSWVDHGGRSGSSLTFKLQNFSNRFKIKADFFSILQKDKFKAIPYGDTLTIGIPNGFVKYLNQPKQPFFVYSIASKELTYLDVDETIKAHNTPGILIAAVMFVILGCYSIYIGRRAKEKTPIW
jgi:hypothetical protein